MSDKMKTVSAGQLNSNSWIPDDFRKQARLAAIERRANILKAQAEDNRKANYEAEQVAEMEEMIPFLVAEVFPKLTMPSSPKVEFLGHGSYNRVFCITIDQSLPGGNPVTKMFVTQPKLEFALRISKTMVNFSEDDEKASLACLQVVAARVEFPVPKVFAFNYTADNALGVPYTVQERIRGEALVHFKADYSHKASLIPQLCSIIEAMAAVTSHAPGAISSENLTVPSYKVIALTQFPVPNASATIDNEELRTAHNIPSRNQTPLGFLLDFAQRWYNYDQSKGNAKRLVIWLQFKVISRSLDRLGFLGDRFHLSHGDLFPRNIMVAKRGFRAAEVTGIIDWDMAVFAPKFVTLAPPTWIWSDLGSHRRGFGDEGSSEKPDPQNFSVPLRDLFRKVASLELLKFATSNECHLARKIWDALMTGMQTTQRRNDALATVNAWAKLHPEDAADLDLCSAQVQPQRKRASSF